MKESSDSARGTVAEDVVEEVVDKIKTDRLAGGLMVKVPRVRPKQSNRCSRKQRSS